MVGGGGGDGGWWEVAAEMVDGRNSRVLLKEVEKRGYLCLNDRRGKK